MGRESAGLVRGLAELRTFGIDYIPHRDDDLLKHVFRSFKATLQQLHIHQRPCDVDRDATELPDTSRLKKLTEFEWRFSPPTSPNQFFPRAEGNALIERHSLEDLKRLPLTDFSLVDLNRLGAGNEDLVDNLDYLPRTIQRLHIPLPPPKELATLLRRKWKSASLREVRMQLARDENAAEWNPWAMGPLRKVC
ncbi:hypothetical protein RQP46_001993 [Phenoliferia psychrophenolica]